MTNRRHPVLEKPPIDEVVCGVRYNSVDALDPFVLGTYWGTRSEEFPQRSLLPAVSDQLTFTFQLTPVRAFLVERDDQFVVQLQNDRFFMNWRNRGRGYPRFSGDAGLCRRSLEEFSRFRAFLAERFKIALAPTMIELTKIDVLRSPEHWSSLEDLGKLLPVTATLGKVQASSETGVDRSIELKFLDRRDGEMTLVQMTTIEHSDGATGIRMEFRTSAPIVGDALDESFVIANDRLNDLFFSIINPSELSRFQGKEGTR